MLILCVAVEILLIILDKYLSSTSGGLSEAATENFEY